MPAAALEPLSPRARRVLVLGSLCSFQSALNLSVMNVAFPDLQKAFPDVPRATLSWVLNTYTIVSASVLIAFGILADRIGRKRVLLGGLVTFTAGSTLGALAPTVAVLIVARTLQALGASAVTPASVALVLDEVPTSRRTFAIATWSGIGSGAAAAGPSLGALLIQFGSWRWAFWMSVPVGVLVFVFSTRNFRESRDPSAPELPDILSGVLLMVSAGTLTLGIVQSRSWGWASPRTVGALVGAVALLTVLVVRSGRVSNPLVNLELFRFASFRQASAASLMFGTGFFALFFGSFQFLRFVWGYSTIQAGFLFLAMPAIITLMSPFAGRLAERFGHGRMLVCAGVLFMSGSVFLAVATGPHPNLPVWFVGLGTLGLAGSLAWPAIFGLVVIGIPPSLFAVATGVNQTFQRVATVFGVALTVTLTDSWRPGDGVGEYRRLWVLMAVGGAAGTLVGLWRPRAWTRPAAVGYVVGGSNP